MDIDAPRPLSWKLIVGLLLVLLLIILLLALGSGSFSLIKTTTQQSEQCPTFNAQTEAFRLAQVAEQARSATPYGGNYGVGSYAICFQGGSGYFYNTPVYPGKDASRVTGFPKNQSHSEQFSYNDLYAHLAEITVDQRQLVGIYLVIFSQIRICDLCKTTMQNWQRELRQEVHTNLVFLSIWQLRFGQGGFDPKQFPGGTGTPVTINNIQQVFIRFTP